MSTPLHIKLLSVLDEHRVAEPFNVSPFMVDHFTRPQLLPYPTFGWNEETSRIAKYFLHDLRNKGYIKFNISDLESNIAFASLNDNTGNVEIDKMDRWFDVVDFNITFTLDALDHLYQYRLTESNILANQASLENLKASEINAKVIRKHSKITIWVAGIGAVAALLNFIYLVITDERYKILSKQVELLQKASQSPSKSQSLTQNPPASQKETSRGR